MTEKSFCSDSEIKEISDNYSKITDGISEALKKSGRSGGVRLMAVTKTVPYEKVNFAANLGIGLLGENRVQEFLGKYEFYDKKSEIHFIGGLQNNKVKYIIDKVSMIHSVNSLKLAQEIDRRSAAAGRTMDVLLEINIAGEETKSGILPDGLEALTEQCLSLDNIRLRGFMAIPPRDADGSNARYFSEMQELFEKYKSRLGAAFDTLSMGMSQDYAQAVEYGSTIVRIGSSLFGYRK